MFVSDTEKDSKHQRVNSHAVWSHLTEYFKSKGMNAVGGAILARDSLRASSKSVLLGTLSRGGLGRALDLQNAKHYPCGDPTRVPGLGVYWARAVYAGIPTRKKSARISNVDSPSGDPLET